MIPWLHIGEGLIAWLVAAIALGLFLGRLLTRKPPRP